MAGAPPAPGTGHLLSHRGAELTHNSDPTPPISPGASLFLKTQVHLRWKCYVTRGLLDSIPFSLPRGVSGMTQAGLVEGLVLARDVWQLSH